MRCLSVLAMASVALGCLNVNSNKCASFIKSQAATASPFCATFTQNVVTATSALPAWATNCDMKPKLVSAECSCHYSGGGGNPPPTSTGGGGNPPPTTTNNGGGGGGPTPTGLTTTLPNSSGAVTSPTPILVSGSYDGGMKRFDRNRKWLLQSP